MSDVSSFILKQFTNALDVEETTDEGVVVEGIAAEYEGKMYVRINGSDLLTPITSSVVGIKDGDFVKVRIKNHQASAEGNVTTPSTGGGGGDVPDEVLDRITELEIAIIGKADIKDLEAEQARIDDLYAKDVTITGDLEAANAKIENLEAQNVTITGDLEAANAKIDNLEATKLDVEIADLKYATIENLEATNAEIHNLEADYGDFKELTTEKITANEAAIKRLDTEKLSAEEADLKYANIDFANIGSAAIENFLSKSGMIGDLVVGDGTVTGTLVGVTIKGDLIEGGTVVADKLVIKGEDGLYYKLNTDGETVGSEQTEYNSLNGSVITAKSVTAEKISVNDLVAFDATIGGFNITESSIYSGVKESVDNTTRGIYMDDEGQFAIGDSNNYLKYFKMEDGTYKLALSVGGSSIEDTKVTDKKSGYLVDIGPNAGKPPIDVVVYGDTKQNLWQNPSGTNNGITVTSNDYGRMTILGTATEAAVIYVNSYILDPGKTYKAVANKTLCDNFVNSKTGAKASVQVFNSDHVQINDNIFGVPNALYTIFKVNEKAEYVAFRIVVYAGQEMNVSDFRVMLREATDDEIAAAQLSSIPADSPELLSASSTPDIPMVLPAYPVALAATPASYWVKPGINGVAPSKITASSKNLVAPNADTSNTGGTLTAKLTGDGGIQYNGKPDKSGWVNIPKYTALPPGTYTMSSLPGGAAYGNTRYEIEAIGLSSGVSRIFNAGSSRWQKAFSFTLTEPSNVAVRMTMYNSYTYDNFIVHPQLEVGSVETSFEPYSGSSTPLDLDGHQLHMLPDGTRDELRIDDSGRVTLVQRVGYVYANGEGNGAAVTTWTSEESGVFDGYLSKVDEPVPGSNVYCDRLPIGSAPIKHVCTWAGANKAIVVRLMRTMATTLEGINEWMKKYPSKIYYQLAKEKEISLGTISLPALPADYAYAWAASDIPAYMDVTYWTVAGKDVSDKINNAQNSANDANDKIDEQLPNIEYARSQIEILNKSIATLVVDENGGSLMTQTSDGWKFNIGGIQSTLDDAMSGIQDVKGDMAGIEDLANKTNDLANDVAKKTAYINMTQDETGAPVMELGQQGGEFKLRITNTSMDFMQGSQRIAYLSNRQLYIQSSVVTDEMKIGATSGYIWKKRANGNMGLRYVTE